MFLTLWTLVSCLTPEDVGARTDRDNDGFIAAESGGADCADDNADIHPGVAEICDGVDQDCNGLVDEDPTDGGLWYVDEDGDGFGAGQVRACSQPSSTSEKAGDCDDGRSDVFPAAEEICDGRDQDCDNLIDEGIPTAVWFEDRDGDGFGVADDTIEVCGEPAGYAQAAGDCDDERSDVSPSAEEVYYDGLDQDCDGLSDMDSDRDGFDALAAGGLDCDDFDSSVNPSSIEVCANGRDDDCASSPQCFPVFDEYISGFSVFEYVASGAMVEAIMPVGNGDIQGSRRFVWIGDSPAYSCVGCSSGLLDVSAPWSAPQGAVKAVGLDRDGDGIRDVLTSNGGQVCWAESAAGSQTIPTCVYGNTVEGFGADIFETAGGLWVLSDLAGRIARYSNDGSFDLVVNVPADSAAVRAELEGTSHGPVVAEQSGVEIMLHTLSDDVFEWSSVSSGLTTDVNGWRFSHHHDVDLDGSSDLVLIAVSADRTQTTLLPVASNGEPQTRLVLGSAPAFGRPNVSIGDVDGDLLPDVALAHPDGLVEIFLNVSPGAPHPVHQRFSSSSTSSRVGVLFADAIPDVGFDELVISVSTLTGTVFHVVHLGGE